MNNSIKFSLIALSACLSAAGAAHAQEVHVSTLGKAPKAVHAEFVRAAQTVCAGESAVSTYSIESARVACVRATEAKAEADYRRIRSLQVALNRGE